MTTRRIAVIVDEDRLSHWQLSVVERLSDLGHVELFLVDTTITAPPRPPLMRLYQFLDARRSRHLADRAPRELSTPLVDLRKGDHDALLTDAVSGAEVVVDLTAQRMSDRLPPDSIVIGPVQRPDEMSLVAALVRGDRLIPTSVWLRTGEQRFVVALGSVAVFRFSLQRTADRVGSRLAHVVGRVAQGLLTDRPLPAGAALDDLGIAPTVTNGPIAQLIASALVGAVRASATRVHWSVVWGERTDGPFQVPSRLRTIEAPAGHFFADPFLADDEGTTVVFFEDFDSRLGRASIAVVELDDPVATSRTVLDLGHHLSYPFVFQHDSSWYMTPEMAESGRVALYRCERFPDRWVEEAVLLEGVVAYDPTVLQFEGRWWLFFSSGTPGAASDDELHVWFSSSLLGPYAAHPMNPVRSDAVGARPAGRIQAVDGTLLRPGQDGSREYGGGIVIHSIRHLTTERYEEDVVARIDGVPGLGVRGVHTINSSPNYVVLDAKHRVARFRPWRGTIKRFGKERRGRRRRP
jgi:hypothetical protein